MGCGVSVNGGEIGLSEDFFPPAFEKRKIEKGTRSWFYGDVSGRGVGWKGV